MPKPTPRAVVAAHSSEIVPKQTMGHKGRGCPLPGSPPGTTGCIPPITHLLLGGPGSASSLTSDWVKPERGLLGTHGLLHERVLLKWSMFITCNKATASNPSCEGECCCWHGQCGAVRAPVQGGLHNLRGGQAAAAKVIGSGPTQAQAFPSHQGHMLFKAASQSPQQDYLAVGWSALLCTQGIAAQGAHALIAIHKGLP